MIPDRERRKQIIERTLREWNYLDEEENVLADAILDALAADAQSVEYAGLLAQIRRARPTVDSPTYRKLMARPSLRAWLLGWLRAR
jgi:aryl carrier-like protein